MLRYDERAGFAREVLTHNMDPRMVEEARPVAIHTGPKFRLQ